MITKQDLFGCSVLQGADLRKPQTHDADPSATQWISFSKNRYRPASATILLSLEDAKGTISDISQVTVRVL